MAVPYYEDYPEDHTHVVIPFNTFTSDDPSISCTITNLVAGDIKIHKDGAVAEKASADGVTVSINFDGITGNHLVIIDTSNDTGAAGFWIAGHEYEVRIEGTTVDAGTINGWIGAFSIERAGGTIALLKLIQAAVITNATGADVAADIIALKAETVLIVEDTGTTLDTLIKDIPTTSELALRTLLAADYTVVGDLGTVQSGDSFAIVNGNHGLVSIQDDVDEILTDTGATLDALIKDIPTVAEFEARSIVAANYVVVGDTIAGVTTCTTNTDLVTAAAVKTAIEAAGSHLTLIKAVTDVLTVAAATKLALSAGVIVAGTVSHDNTAASTTVFYSDDITEATADHFNGRIVIFTSGALQYQATDITDYELAAGEGKFTCTALTEAPADNSTFIII